jgi:dTDP-4-dehydrorhamnose reductase
LHLSTDCVFSGRKGGYREADQPDPVDTYGLSKLLGEPESGALTLRTSVIGPELASSNGLYEWFRSRHGQAVSGYRNAIFSGLTTLELSRVMLQVLESHPTLEGVWHVSSEPIAKLELLSKLNRAAQLGVTLLPDENFVCDRSLDSIRFQSETGYRPPSWDAMVQEMVEDGKSYAVPRG